MTRMTYKKLAVLVLQFIILVIKSQSDFCECCSYPSLQFKYTEYQTIFPPEIIRKNKFKELMVYSSGRRRDDTVKSNKIKISKNLIEEHREIKFYFNEKGYVSYMTHYNRQGKPHSTYKFDRDSSGKLIKLTFAYIDSLEKLISDMGLRTTVYTYSNNKLIKEKELGMYGEDLPDERSKFIRYKYTKEGRLVEEFAYSYYDEKYKAKYVASIEYSNNGSNVTKTITNNNKAWMTEYENYSGNKITESKSIDTKTKKIIRYALWKYDGDDFLKYYWVKVGSAGECPENNGYIDYYFYNDQKLIDRITHNFNDYTCEMTFHYK